MIYTFSYRDRECDIYEREHESLRQARKEIRELRALGREILETWIHKTDKKGLTTNIGDFVGRFTY